MILRDFKCLFQSEISLERIFGAWVISEPWSTGSRDFCELWKFRLTCEPKKIVSKQKWFTGYMDLFLAP